MTFFFSYELRYGVRLVNLDINPLSEAFLLWADVPGPDAHVSWRPLH